MGNPNDQVQCALLVAEQYEDETTQLLVKTPKVTPEPATGEDQEPVADPVSEVLKEDHEPAAGEVLVSETPDENYEKGVDEILEKMNGIMDFEKEVAKQDDAAAEKEPAAKDEVLDEKSGEEVNRPKLQFEEDHEAADN